jgi:hypothetical protein
LARISVFGLPSDFGLRLSAFPPLRRDPLVWVWILPVVVLSFSRFFCA